MSMDHPTKIFLKSIFLSPSEADSSYGIGIIPEYPELSKAVGFFGQSFTEFTNLFNTKYSKENLESEKFNTFLGDMASLIISENREEINAIINKYQKGEVYQKLFTDFLPLLTFTRAIYISNDENIDIFAKIIADNIELESGDSRKIMAMAIDTFTDSPGVNISFLKTLALIKEEYGKKGIDFNIDNPQTLPSIGTSISEKIFGNIYKNTSIDYFDKLVELMKDVAEKPENMLGMQISNHILLMENGGTLAVLDARGREGYYKNIPLPLEKK